MEDNNNRNFILAIVLSGMVLLLWQVFYAAPQMEKERLKKQQATELAKSQHKPGARVVGQPPVGGLSGAPVAQPQAGSPPQLGDAPQAGGAAIATPGVPAIPGALPTAAANRDVIIKATPRVPIDTPSLSGSINLKGGRIDDLVMRGFHETVSKDSPEVVLFSPSGGAHPFYAQYGWIAPKNSKLKKPDDNTMWTQKGSGALMPSRPVTLSWDNGQGVSFERIISVDKDYMFTVRQRIVNRTGHQLTLYPYALISRHEQPVTKGFYILHEGLVGVLGEEGLQEVKYKDILEEKSQTFKGKGGWLGMTDKYWAAAVIPSQQLEYAAHFTGSQNGETNKRFQADYLLGGVVVPAGGSGEVSGQLFAGAKKVELIDKYSEDLNIEKFDLMIDWGWFYFITKPMFAALHFFYGLVGNFGIAILLVTVFVKALFYPLANKSYESMSKMKKLQPEMERIRKRFKDDKVKQQQEMMALYQKEGANPLSGCLPMLIQIPVFFSLYKVLFVTLEMRHAPFFGWIQDLSAPDPTSVFNLFGLLPFATPSLLHLGVWPLIMGVTMWIQMKLNPQQSDPTQQMIFNWMPVIFTFMLARFPAGLVIYWAWNNTLSVAQQWWIMRKNNVEVDLLENTGLRKLFARVSEKVGRS